jgi:hypothetical protein
VITSDTKYVVFDGYNGEQIIIFPKIIQHSVMADDVKKSSFGGMRPISGGFIVDGHCVGKSESLRMVSRGDLDTALIPKLLDMCEPEEVEILKLPSKATTRPSELTRNQRKRKAKRKGVK